MKRSGIWGKPRFIDFAPFHRGYSLVDRLVSEFFAPAIWCAERTLLALEITDNLGLGITRTLHLTNSISPGWQVLSNHGSSGP